MIFRKLFTGAVLVASCTLALTRAGVCDTSVSAEPLNLAALVARGLAADPRIADARAALADLAATAARSNAVLLPVVEGRLENDLDRSVNLVGTDALYGLIPSSRFSLNTAELRAVVRLPSVRTFATADADGFALQAGAAALRRDTALAAVSLIAAYFDIAGARLQLDAAAADVRYHAELLSVAQQRERAGLVAGVEVDRARVDSLRSESALASVQAQMTDATEALAARAGLNSADTLAVAGAIPQPAWPNVPVDALIASALERRSEIIAARLRVAAARAAARAQQWTWLPEVVLTAAVGNQYSPTFGPLTPGGGDPGFWDLSASARLTLPFFDGGVRRKERAALLAHADAASVQLDAFRRGVEADVRAAVRDGETARRNVELEGRAVALARETARIAQRQYAAGVATLSDASAAQRDAIATNAALVQSQKAYLSALLRLRIAVGDDGTDRLVAFGTP